MCSHSHQLTLLQEKKISREIEFNSILSPVTIDFYILLSAQHFKHLLSENPRSQIHREKNYVNNNEDTEFIEPRKVAPLCTTTKVNSPRDKTLIGNCYRTNLYMRLLSDVPELYKMLYCSDDDCSNIFMFHLSDDEKESTLMPTRIICKDVGDDNEITDTCIDQRKEVEEQYSYMLQDHINRRVSVVGNWKELLAYCFQFSLTVEVSDDSNAANVRAEAITMPYCAFHMSYVNLIPSSCLGNGEKMRDQNLFCVGLLYKTNNPAFAFTCGNWRRQNNIDNQLCGLWVKFPSNQIYDENSQCSTTKSHWTLLKNPLVYAACSYYKQSYCTMIDDEPRFTLIIGSSGCPSSIFSVVSINTESSSLILDYEAEVDMNCEEDDFDGNILHGKLQQSEDNVRNEIFQQAMKNSKQFQKKISYNSGHQSNTKPEVIKSKLVDQEKEKEIDKLQAKVEELSNQLKQERLNRREQTIINSDLSTKNYAGKEINFEVDDDDDCSLSSSSSSYIPILSIDKHTIQSPSTRIMPIKSSSSKLWSKSSHHRTNDSRDFDLPKIPRIEFDEESTSSCVSYSY